jgi:hypothetical protein
MNILLGDLPAAVLSAWASPDLSFGTSQVIESTITQQVIRAPLAEPSGLLTALRVTVGGPNLSVAGARVTSMSFELQDRTGAFYAAGALDGFSVGAFDTTAGVDIGTYVRALQLRQDPGNFASRYLTGDDRILGNAAANALQGGAGRDELRGAGGDDVLDGGSGVDTALYGLPRSSYLLAKAGANWNVKALSGNEGTDTLIDVERLRFDNTSLALDLSGNAGTAAKIIGALFGPAVLKNKDFVGIGLQWLDQGSSYPSLVDMAVKSVAFKQQLASPSNTDFVKLVYQNVTGTVPDPADLNYYVALLDVGVYTQSQLAFIACEMPINAAHIDLVGLASTGIEFTPQG